MPKHALILVDYENAWRDTSSDDYISDCKALIAKTNTLIDFCRKNKYKIIFTRHVEVSGPGWRDKTKSTELFEELHKQKTDVVIVKHKISPFYQTTLEKELKGIKEIVVAGILTNLCVRSLVQDAYDREFGMTIISDCCLAMDRKTHEFTLKDLKETREEVNIVPVNKFVF